MNPFFTVQAERKKNGVRACTWYFCLFIQLKFFLTIIFRNNFKQVKEKESEWVRDTILASGEITFTCEFDKQYQKWLENQVISLTAVFSRAHTHIHTHTRTPLLSIVTSSRFYSHRILLSLLQLQPWNTKEGYRHIPSL